MMQYLLKTPHQRREAMTTSSSLLLQAPPSYFHGPFCVIPLTVLYQRQCFFPIQANSMNLLYTLNVWYKRSGTLDTHL